MRIAAINIFNLSQRVNLFQYVIDNNITSLIEMYASVAHGCAIFLQES